MSAPGSASEPPTPRSPRCWSAAAHRPGAAVAPGARGGPLRECHPARRDGIALSTDGVGTKLVVAEQLGRWDTVGIDCVAMNANDLICVGAEPLAMLDYVAVPEADPAVMRELGRGLRRGAELAGIEIPGGELAQIGEIVRGLDLVGACFGTVDLDSIVTGAGIEPGDPGARTAVLGPALEWVHARAPCARRRPDGGRDTRPAARRRDARADRDLRHGGGADALGRRGPRSRAHHLGRAREPASPRSEGRLRDRRRPARASDLLADPGARVGVGRRDVRGVQHGLWFLLRGRGAGRGCRARAAAPALSGREANRPRNRRAGLDRTQIVPPRPNARCASTSGGL